MTTILDNELVWKYFGCQHPKWQTCDCVQGDAPQKILQAMQRPVNPGDKTIISYSCGVVWEEHTYEGNPVKQMHPFMLRLPDRFQEKQKCDCRPFPECSCGMNCEKCHRTKPQGIAPEAEAGRPVDKVEKQLQNILINHGVLAAQPMEYWLRDLVKLARESK